MQQSWEDSRQTWQRKKSQCFTVGGLFRGRQQFEHRFLKLKCQLTVNYHMSSGECGAQVHHLSVGMMFLQMSFSADVTVASHRAETIALSVKPRKVWIKHREAAVTNRCDYFSLSGRRQGWQSCDLHSSGEVSSLNTAKLQRKYCSLSSSVQFLQKTFAISSPAQTNFIERAGHWLWCLCECEVLWPLH